MKNTVRKAFTICLIIFVSATFCFPSNAYAAKMSFTKSQYKIKHEKTVKKKKGKKVKIKYWTSNKTIATVKNGRIIARKRGKCYVYAKAGKKKCRAKVYVTANPKLNAESIPVLTYHRVVTDETKSALYKNDSLKISVSNLENQIKWLKSNGYVTINADEFYNWYCGRSFIPENAVLITFDDGYYETYYLAYPIIKKYGVKATNFIIGSYTPEITPQFTGSNNLKRIGIDKMEETKAEYPDFDYQSHTYNMHFVDNGQYRADSMTTEEIREDIELMRQQFGFRYIAYPYGATNEIFKQELEDSNIKMAFGYKNKGYAKRTDDPFEISRIKISGNISMRVFKKIINRYYD